MQRSLRLMSIVTATSLAACASTSTLSDSGPVAVTARVTEVANQSGYTPGFTGYKSEYDLAVAIEPSTTPNANYVIEYTTPVTITGTNSSSTDATADSIKVGDLIQIWSSGPVVYGLDKAHDGAPAYVGTKVTILR